jgi:hypothetical protein
MKFDFPEAHVVPWAAAKMIPNKILLMARELRVGTVNNVFMGFSVEWNSFLIPAAASAAAVF